LVEFKNQQDPFLYLLRLNSDIYLAKYLPSSKGGSPF
jgi:hypothetical protein